MVQLVTNELRVKIVVEAGDEATDDEHRPEVDGQGSDR